MTTEAKLEQWVIDGIEFEAKSAYDRDYTGKLPAGIIRDPNDSDLFFFSKASFAATELDQLIEEGYLVFFYSQALGITTPSTFCVRLALDSRNRFYLVEGMPEIATCILCKRDFPFIDNGDNMIETAPARGPSYGSGGEPPEWDSACTECMETDPDDRYDEEPYEEDLWETRGII